eukprot:jgi/Botrbrau1/3548/Bobra.0078s0005.1
MSDAPVVPDSQQNNNEQQLEGEAASEQPKACSRCAATKTPMWRNGPAGAKTLCNACGVRLYRQTSKVPKKGEAGDNNDEVPVEGAAKLQYLDIVRRLKAATNQEDVGRIEFEIRDKTELFPRKCDRPSEEEGRGRIRASAANQPPKRL